MEKEAEVLSLAAKAGRILLENGAEISRVEETMERIAGNYGEKGENFFVLSNGIFTTGDGYSHVEYIPIKGARLDKVADVNQLSRDIEAGKYSIGEAGEKLEAIRHKAPKAAWEQLLGAFVGSGGFCAIFGGGLLDCAASAIAGLIVFAVVLFGGEKLTKTLSNILGGLIGTAICMTFHRIGFGTSLANMIIGALIPLIPGVAFTNGLRDISNEDYLAGTTRLLDAIMVFLCIALGTALAFIVHSWIKGGMIELSGTTTDSITAAYALQLIAAFFGTAAFSIVFGAPRRCYAVCGLVGMMGWLVYLLITRMTGLTVVGGTFFATICVALLSHFSAVRMKTPSTVFLICGIFPLIPGAGVFWSSYYIVSSRLSMALSTGFTAVKVTIAIVFGIIIINFFGIFVKLCRHSKK